MPYVGYDWFISTDATSSANTEIIWADWAQEATTSASTTAWTSWMATDSTNYALLRSSWRTTPEYQRAWEEDKQRRELEAKERKKAAEVAEALLKSCLNPEQLQEYDKDQQFHVISSEGNRFLIDVRKRQHNIHLINSKGHRVEELCVYQTGNTPLADNALAQKLALETDERKLRQTANVRRLRISA